VNSRLFVPVLSEGALYGSINDVSSLIRTSFCDNVILEHQLALELEQRKLMQIWPVVVDVGADSKRASNEVVTSIGQKVSAHLHRMGLGVPLTDNRSPKDTVDAIFAKAKEAPAYVAFAEDERYRDLRYATAVITDRVVALGGQEKFDVVIGFHESNQDVFQMLEEHLIDNGVRVRGRAASDGTYILQQPTVFVPIISQASVGSFVTAKNGSGVDPFLLELRIALEVGISYIFPIFLGEINENGTRDVPNLFGSGSSVIVNEVERKLATIFGRSLRPQCSKETVSMIARNQGCKVGPATLDAVVEKLVGIVKHVESLAQGQDSFQVTG
jgi:hypothetical protein